MGIDWRARMNSLPDMHAELAALVRQIPAGRVTTYGRLAAALGSAMANRWVGHALLNDAFPADVPLHRVIRATGEPGEYAIGGTAAKCARLSAEGVAIDDQAIDLARFGFDQFETAFPLQMLETWQREMAAAAMVAPPEAPILRVAGVDLSYRSPGEGVAAYMLCELPETKIIYEKNYAGPTRFPYITSFLAFRETPLLLDLLAEVARDGGPLADVLLVDGSGILHPRGIGSATQLGVVSGYRTIGVTKKHLCGEGNIADIALGEDRPVRIDGQVVGVAMRFTASRRPIFVSPGHRIDLATAIQVVRATFAGHRLPEPIYWADRNSRAAANVPGDSDAEDEATSVQS